MRGIPSPFIKIYERGRDSPYPQPLARYYRVRTSTGTHQGPAGARVTVFSATDSTFSREKKIGKYFPCDHNA